MDPILTAANTALLLSYAVRDILWLRLLTLVGTGLLIGLEVRGSGDVQVLGWYVLFVVLTGTFVGEMGFLTGDAPGADVIAVGFVHYVSWDSDDLHGLLQSDPQLKAALHGILGIDLAHKLSCTT